jgi:hypothetical protein
MFSSRSKAERTTAQAWDYLSSAMTAAGDTAQEVGGHTADAAARFADQASKQAGKIADRAGQRGQEFGRRGQKLAGNAQKKVQKKAQKKGNKLAKQAGKRGSALAGVASDKADLAWSRANAAADALAGRKRRPWGLLLGAGLVGGAIGFAAAGAIRASKEREAETHELEMAGNTVIVTPSYDE